MVKAIMTLSIILLHLTVSCSNPKMFCGVYRNSESNYEWLTLRENRTCTFCYWFCSNAHGCDSGTFVIAHDSILIQFPATEPHVVCYPYDSIIYYTDTNGLELYKTVEVKRYKDKGSAPESNLVFFLLSDKVYGKKEKSVYSELWEKTSTTLNK